jgi:putative membrane protein
MVPAHLGLLRDSASPTGMRLLRGRNKKMIERYRDHAANERTYLAWVRTGITIMVLGFIVEKFEIFLASLTGLLTDAAHQVSQSTGARYVSLALVSLGVLVILAGAIRFFRVKAELDAPSGVRFRGTVLVMMLTGALLGFGIYLLLYLARII